jgi:putative redox protein
MPIMRSRLFRPTRAKLKACEAKPRSGSFPFTVDEPPTLGGTDAGPNPAELVLAALATCQEITYRAYATALGIPLESVSVRLEGLLDLRGFFAVKDDVRAGFSEVRGVVNLKSSAPAAELAKLKEVVDAHCPVLDILRAPLPVVIQLETERALQPA